MALGHWSKFVHGNCEANRTYIFLYPGKFRIVYSLCVDILYKVSSCHLFFVLTVEQIVLTSRSACLSAVVQEMLHHDRMLAKTFGPANTTPLISAAMRGHIEVVELLLEQDDFGLVEMARDNGKNGLHFAARQGHIGIVKALLEKDPQLARRNDKKGQTALHMAVKGTSCDVLRALVDADPAIVMLPDKNGNTALHVATRKKRAEVFTIDNDKLFKLTLHLQKTICAVFVDSFSYLLMIIALSPFLSYNLIRQSCALFHKHPHSSSSFKEIP